MKKHEKSYVLYALGLKEESLVALDKYYNSSPKILKPEEDISYLQQDNISGVLWITLDSWLSLNPEKRLEIRDISKILVLPPDANINHLDEFGSLGFSSTLVEPLQSNKIHAAMSHSLEKYNIHQDVHRMAREIILDRELLERKHTNLKFLLSFFSNTSGLLLPEEILNVAKATLTELLPVQSIGAFIWHYGEQMNHDEEFIPYMFIPAKEKTTSWDSWERALLKGSRSISRQVNDNYQAFSLQTCEDATEDSGNNTELSLALPLYIKEQAIGIVIINLSEEFPLGRDNIEIIEAAMSHMTVALRGTWLYKQMKNQSERDSLTSLYNRRYFDSALQHEIKRHERYGNELGIILLDIDHFKEVNDTYGHLCGDEVLCAIGKIIVEELRDADCISRYGGEEFLMLLPYTNAEQAWVLAERLRCRIEAHTFCKGILAKNITASFGVTNFRPELGVSATQLINYADVALYRAKAQGRNCSVLEQITSNVNFATDHIRTISA